MKRFLILMMCLLFTSCTVYTEKQTEAVSRTIYATKDSIDNARFDLAKGYSNEATRLIREPKSRIPIQALYGPKKDKNGNKIVTKTEYVKVPGATEYIDSHEGERILVVPEDLNGVKVVAVGSVEFEELKMTKDVALQLQKDYLTLHQEKLNVDQELQKQFENHAKMVEDLQKLQKELAEKTLALFKARAFIAACFALIILGIILKLRGLWPI